VYNVYSQEIDPKNMMPAPNQSPAPGQSVPLPVERVKSTIPKGGVDGNWLYPSPQMFYNSLVRKKKADNVDASEMNIVVSIHNEMNERTWALLREWEAAHTRCAGRAGRARRERARVKPFADNTPPRAPPSEHTDGQPSLRRFQGNPYKLSPLARVKSWLGYGFPFDRHDWFVDRGDSLVHYVIDYYYNPAGAANAPPARGDAVAALARSAVEGDPPGLPIRLACSSSAARMDAKAGTARAIRSNGSAARMARCTSRASCGWSCGFRMAGKLR
jgi:cytochrome c heme-lyase